jgi:dephospho-CoA kinase
MTPAKLAAILGKQMPDSEKRARAHFMVDSSRGVDSARAQVRGILRAVAFLPGRPKTAEGGETTNVG